MKYLKFILPALILLLLPVTIFASKNIDCEQGFKRNNLGICEEVKAPANAKLNSYKDDFECDRGYKKNKQSFPSGKENWSCDEIKLPENAILTVAGSDWTCISEYKREGDSCKKVTLPENAKFHTQGSDFYCNFGYKKIGDKCERLEIPSNASWSYDGNDWECNRGFKLTDDKKSCIEVKIPDNAQSNYLETFTCNSGYKQVGDKCEKQPDIANGTFYTTGADFYCAKGYKKNESERRCDEIKAPENAHKDDLSIEGWTCNGEYVRRGDKCEKFTLPEHGYWFNNTWGCELGFRKNPTAESCEKINLPENAKYVVTFDGWECNSGFKKNYHDNRCDKI